MWIRLKQLYERNVSTLIIFCVFLTSAPEASIAVSLHNPCQPFTCLVDNVHRPFGYTNPFAVDQRLRGQWSLRTPSDLTNLCSGYRQAIECWKAACPAVVISTTLSQASLGTFGSTTNQLNKFIKVEALSSSPVGYGGSYGSSAYSSSGAAGSYGNGGPFITAGGGVYNNAPPYTLNQIDENTFAYIAQGVSLIESVCSSAFPSQSGELIRQWQQCDTTRFQLAQPDNVPFGRGDKVPLSKTAADGFHTRQVFLNASNGFTTSALLTAGSARSEDGYVRPSQNFEFVPQPTTARSAVDLSSLARDAEPAAPPPTSSKTSRKGTTERQDAQRRKRAAGFFGLPPVDNCRAFRDALRSEASTKCGPYGYELLLNFVLLHAGCTQQLPLQLQPLQAVPAGIDGARPIYGGSFVPGSGFSPPTSSSTPQLASLVQLPAASLASAANQPSCSPLTMLNCAEDASLFDFLSSSYRMMTTRDAYCRDSARLFQQCAQQKCPQDLELNRKLSPALSTVGNVCADSQQFSALSNAVGRCPMFDNARFAPTTGAENSCIDTALKRSAADGTGTVRTPADELCVRIDAAMYCRSVTLRCSEEQQTILRNYVKRFAACITIAVSGSFGTANRPFAESESIVAASSATLISTSTRSIFISVTVSVFLAAIFARGNK